MSGELPFEIELRHGLRTVARGDVVTRPLSPNIWRALLLMVDCHPEAPAPSALDAAIWPGKLMDRNTTPARSRVISNLRAALVEVDIGVIDEGGTYRLQGAANLRSNRRRTEACGEDAPARAAPPITLPRVLWLERAMP